MRRNRAIAASATHNLCIFCACRFGVTPVSICPTPPVARFSTSRTFRQTSAAEPAGWTHDPTSSLTRMEQIEKFNRLQVRRLAEEKRHAEEKRAAEETKRKLERMEAEEKARRKAAREAKAQSFKSRRQQQERDGVRWSSDPSKSDSNRRSNPYGRFTVGGQDQQEKYNHQSQKQPLNGSDATREQAKLQQNATPRNQSDAAQLHATKKLEFSFKSVNLGVGKEAAANKPSRTHASASTPRDTAKSASSRSIDSPAKESTKPFQVTRETPKQSPFARETAQPSPFAKVTKPSFGRSSTDGNNPSGTEPAAATWGAMATAATKQSILRQAERPIVPVNNQMPRPSAAPASERTVLHDQSASTSVTPNSPAVSTGVRTQVPPIRSPHRASSPAVPAKDEAKAASIEMSHTKESSERKTDPDVPVRPAEPELVAYRVPIVNVRASEDTSARRCARCGEIGHIARDCTNVSLYKRSQLEASRAEQPFERRGVDREAMPARGGRRAMEEEGDRDYRPARRGRGDIDDQADGLDKSARRGRRDLYDEADDSDRPARRGRRALDDEGQRSRGAASGRAGRFEVDDEDEGTQVETKRTFKKPREPRGGRAFNEDEDDDAAAREEARARKAARQAAKAAKKAEVKYASRAELARLKAINPGVVKLPEFVSVSNLAQKLGIRYETFVDRLEELGYDDIFPGKVLNSETSGMIAMEYNFEPSFEAGVHEDEARDLHAKPLPDRETMPVRPPVVTIMGHVDHGKTTILDYIRKSSVAAGEAGGITQHIGAFSVSMSSSGKTVTFLDTPGHEAFLSMRKRGATVTDIVILVVAGDDSVKPQTLEALKHARDAKVPIIVAINKVDKPEADIDRCKKDLARHGVEIEDYGGDTQVVPVSGKTGLGMDELEENIVTLSEILDHRADPTGDVEGWIIEASTKLSGRVATILVRRGTLKPGDIIVAGKTWARVRTLKNEGGELLQEVGPGMPVEVDGWDEQPVAGDEVLQATNEQKAASVIKYRQVKEERERSARDMQAINDARKQHQDKRAEEKAAEQEAKRADRAARLAGEDLGAIDEPTRGGSDSESGQKVVNFIVKGDVSGSVEAVSAYVLGVSHPLIAPKILSSGVGPVHESDIDLASASDATIIAFNLPSNNEAAAGAEAAGVKIVENNIIYRVLEDVKSILEDLLPPIISLRVLGEAEVAQLFDFNVKGRKYIRIAGCKVRNGVVSRGARVRVLRQGEKIHDGTVSSLKNVKKEVEEMRKGTECGMTFDGFEDFQAGDLVQTYEEISEKRKL